MQNFSRFVVIFIVFKKVLTFWEPAELKITLKNLKYSLFKDIRFSLQKYYAV